MYLVHGLMLRDLLLLRGRLRSSVHLVKVSAIARPRPKGHAVHVATKVTVVKLDVAGPTDLTSGSDLRGLRIVSTVGE
jgi:hypothetical protein